VDLSKALAELRAELQLVDEAILALSGIAARTRRRGRPPAWLTKLQPAAQGEAYESANASEAPENSRKSMSPSARKAASERMKKYWANRRRNKK
jgi:hypothetical protein